MRINEIASEMNSSQEWLKIQPDIFYSVGIRKFSVL
jgi:hypothetical protein